MDEARWAQIHAAFDELIELESAERAPRLAQLRDRDPELGRWVDALLDGDEHAERVPGRPGQPAAGTRLDRLERSARR